MNIKAILSPNSEFDRKQELNKLLYEDISESEKEILKQCKTQDDESIGLIGCILKDNSLENKARLLIASKNIYHESLSKIADGLLENEDLGSLTESIVNRFIREQNELTEVEDKIYFMLMNILKDDQL
ncbi:hypothetical protein [Urechidicola vernalis]|uniref:Uncharacterized protein n=1 Tax=Urechidicola vernalis TaxID=3075600 RepID=A0ABU2Y4V4_9FLAO|nr:hypothetical protein [Urechidicola sp. P050]MDT0552737.1 hypothetical protein [Urechidicola sp. P050]